MLSYPKFSCLFSRLDDREISALVALYSVNSKCGQGAYLVDSNLGVWFSDLSIESGESQDNGLGLYVIEDDTLNCMLKKRVIRQDVNAVNRNVCIKKVYKLVPKARDQIKRWLIENNVSLPNLVGFNLNGYLATP